ncbi:hypothetical protein [Methylocystis echinoides]|uniref:hypothetical protein n=1 Tax=Methylocystis echinoides TaxID=29468 RepID=UPI003435D347
MSKTKAIMSAPLKGTGGRVANPPMTATQKALADKATPLTVTRGSTGRIMDGGNLIPNGRKAPAPGPQARQDIAQGRNIARPLQPTDALSKSQIADGRAMGPRSGGKKP